MRRRRKILKGAAALLVVAAVAGLIYEHLGEQHDQPRLPPIGRLVDIGGRRLNIYCSGEGRPAVILDTGNGEPGCAWSYIQPEIAKYTRACWFDRAGEGWSDPGPFPRTSAATAKDLHDLLAHAGTSHSGRSPRGRAEGGTRGGQRRRQRSTGAQEIRRLGVLVLFF